jgi:hypothetical protein
MPLSVNALDLLRVNLDQIRAGQRVKLVTIGILTPEQHSSINAIRLTEGLPEIAAEVVFIGHHIYKSRIAGDGYSIDDVVEQIASAMGIASVVLKTGKMTAMENPNPRADRYGNWIKDRAVFECSARHPRPELFSIVPKGDLRKPIK